MNTLKKSTERYQDNNTWSNETIESFNSLIVEESPMLQSTLKKYNTII